MTELEALPLPDRIKSRIAIDGCGCWRWLGHIEKTGYAAMLGLGGRRARPHQFVYEAAHGPVPAGLELDHVRSRGCLHRDCCNPDHMEPVTHAENIRRSREATKPFCKRGHPRTPENRTAQRSCRICDTQRVRERRRELASLRLAAPSRGEA